MNTEILKPQVQDFIFGYTEGIDKLAFAGSPFTRLTVQELLQQVDGRRKIRNKLPTWHSIRNIIYPPKVNLEQTSSEITAKYKATIVKGNTLADLTGGFGVDAYYFSDFFKKVDYYEINDKLCKIASHNFNILNKNNIHCHNDSGLLAIGNNYYDVLYADPSRRNAAKGKVFFLQDCEPNIPENLGKLLPCCSVLMIKTSPMLDITEGLKELPGTIEIHVVAIENEVKELLWLIKKDYKQEPKIRTINFSRKSNQVFDFDFNQKVEPFYSEAQRFLYEPNAAIMKSGGFDLISEVLKVKKLHPNTHLFTDEVLREFPGRVFSIKQNVQYNKSEMRKLTGIKANVATRNFPETVAQIKQKWNIRDGGDVYLFFIKDINDERRVFMCSKMN